MTSDRKPVVGLIGPGIMGVPMMLNLITAGYEVYFYGRRREAGQALEQAGARYFTSPAALAAEVDVIISIVSDTPDVEAVLFGKQGVVEGVRSGAMVIDMSTISPVATQDFAQRLSKLGVRMLDAPVSGGDIGAREGMLTIMVGGLEADFQAALPLFEVMGKTITHIGDHGAGQVVKACNNLIIAQTVIAVSEAFVLAEQSGVDLSKARQALMGGFAGSKVMEIHAKRMIDNNYQPGFKTKLHHKDLQIVASTLAAMNLNLPGTQQAIGYMQQLVEQGAGELDSAALMQIVKQKAATH